MNTQEQTLDNLLEGTIYNPEASMFIQSITGHAPLNSMSTILKNLEHIVGEAQEGIKVIKAAMDEGRHLTQDETKEVRDAYCDVRVLLDGAQQMTKLPLHDDYKLVLAALMTRFDPPGENGDVLEHAKLTQLKYRDMGVITRIHNQPNVPRYVNIVDGYVDGMDVDKKEYPIGKWLKSYRYEQPVFPDSDVLV